MHVQMKSVSSGLVRKKLSSTLPNEASSEQGSLLRHSGLRIVPTSARRGGTSGEANGGISENGAASSVGLLFALLGGGGGGTGSGDGDGGSGGAASGAAAAGGAASGGTSGGGAGAVETLYKIIYLFCRTRIAYSLHIFPPFAHTLFPTYLMVPFRSNFQLKQHCVYLGTQLA